MARIFQTGFETGHVGVFDISSSLIRSASSRGSWSDYCGDDNAVSGFAATWDAAAGEFYGGFGFFNVGSVNARRIVTFSAPNGTVQASIVITAGGHLAAYRGDGWQFGGGTLLGTGTFTLVADTWYFVEYHIVIDDAVGVFEIKIDEAIDLTVTGADTRVDGTFATCDRFYVGSDSFSSQHYWDDLYVSDTVGARNIGYAGDTQIEGIETTADGDNTGLTPSAGSNWDCVDERPPSNGDYVSGTGTAAYDLYELGNIAAGVSVQAVTVWLRAKKSDAGAANVAHMLKSDGNEDQGSDLALSTSYAYYRKNYDEDPTDSVRWTRRKVNGLQAGEKSR